MCPYLRPAHSFSDVFSCQRQHAASLEVIWCSYHANCLQKSSWSVMMADANPQTWPVHYSTYMQKYMVTHQYAGFVTKCLNGMNHVTLLTHTLSIEKIHTKMGWSLLSSIVISIPHLGNQQPLTVPYGNSHVHWCCPVLIQPIGRSPKQKAASQTNVHIKLEAWSSSIHSMVWYSRV